MSHPELNDLIAADELRVKAILTGEPELLEKSFSEDLHYCHSNGAVDTKASFMDMLASGRTRYIDISYVQRYFTPVTDNVAFMTGQVSITSESADKVIGTGNFSFLVVWKKEDGSWRFRGWQSARLPA
jgi:hypothetical protein